jgi:hypothetical protein
VTRHIEREDGAVDDVERETLQPRHQVDRLAIDGCEPVDQYAGLRDDLLRQQLHRPRRKGRRRLVPLLPPVVTTGAEEQALSKHRPQDPLHRRGAGISLPHSRSRRAGSPRRIAAGCDGARGSSGRRSSNAAAGKAAKASPRSAPVIARHDSG